jgi:hypothetical protein
MATRIWASLRSCEVIFLTLGNVTLGSDVDADMDPPEKKAPRLRDMNLGA